MNFCRPSAHPPAPARRRTTNHRALLLLLPLVLRLGHGTAFGAWMTGTADLFPVEMIAAKSTEGGASPKIRSVILPLWYRTAPAYAGYSGLLILAGALLINLRAREIRKRNLELNRLLEIRMRELEQAGRAKDEFLADISHEILNPMNGIIGLADSMHPPAFDPASRHQLELLRRCARHLSSLLEDVLDFSRAQAGALRVESIPFDLSELMQSIMALTAADSARTNIPVEIAISPGVPRRLRGDPRRIRQILINYIGNALKYSNGGEVGVTVWRNGTDQDSCEIFFAVSDEGPGISPEEQAGLFMRFERGEGGRLSQIPGAGLGLAHCKILAEAMGGHVWVTSTPGEGSCFYFSAGFCLTKEEDATRPDLIPCAMAPQSQRALVVDDEEYNRITLSATLEALGIEVDCAPSPVEALALAESRQFNFVFLDYSIPDSDGPAIARIIRNLPGPTSRAVIVAISAFHTGEKRAACIAAGMDAFLEKPATRERLCEVLGLSSPEVAALSSGFPPSPSAGQLANLRLLARRKAVPLSDELVRYVFELESELNEVRLSLQTEDRGRVAYYAHLLYGRCSFIVEKKLPSLLREIEAAAANGRWEDGFRIFKEAEACAARLRVTLFSEIPSGQRG